MIEVIIITPLIFGLFLLIGALILEPLEHGAIRIFMILLSLLTYFISSWFGVLALIEFYTFTAMQEAIVTGVWILGTMISVIITYFVIYAFYKSTHAAAQKENEMMLQ